MEKTLTDRTTKAASWRILSSLVQFVLRFGSSVVLARILPVDVFGLFGMAMIVVGFISIISEAGMIPAIVQKANLTELHIRVGFSLSILVGIILTAILSAGAQLASNLYNAENLNIIIRWLSLGFVLKSFGVTADALLQRRLAFQKLFWANTLSYCLGYVVIVIALALAGWGIWALVWASLAEAFLRSVLLIFMEPHPKIPSLAAKEAKDLINFGFGMSITRVTNYVARSGDYFVVGRLLGSEALGLYSRAYQLVMLPTAYLSSPLSNVLFPAYASIQDDTIRLRKAYHRSLSVSSIIVMPLLAGMAIAAPEIVVVIFGEKWAGAISAFRLLCVGGIGRSIYNLVDALARAKGAVYKQLWRHSLYAVMIVLGSIIAVKWDIEGVAVAVMIVMMIMSMLMTGLANQLTSSAWKDYIRTLIPGTILALAVVFTLIPVRMVLMAKSVDGIVLLLLSVLVMLVVFLLIPKNWLGEGYILLAEQFSRMLETIPAISRRVK